MNLKRLSTKRKLNLKNFMIVNLLIYLVEITTHDFGKRLNLAAMLILSMTKKMRLTMGK